MSDNPIIRGQNEQWSESVRTADVDGPVGADDDLGPAAVDRGEEQPDVVRHLEVVRPLPQRGLLLLLPLCGPGTGAHDDGSVVNRPGRLR